MYRQGRISGGRRMSFINWQYCKNPDDVNRAIGSKDSDWEGLESAEQVINITYDSHFGCYIAFWRVEE